jgi:peptidoglycan/LPS O-acetylase OafA/YrhL
VRLVTTTDRPRIDALDGLRSLAVLLVIGHHWHIGSLEAGYIGVDVFFVLSGFLITGILRRELERDGRLAMGRYAARRAFRLVPALAVLLAAMWIGLAAIERLRTQAGVLAQNTVASLFYVHNYVVIFDFDAFTWATNHLWSLSAEGQFYVLWPIVMAFAWKRWGRSGVLAAALTGIGLVFAWRGVLFASGRYGHAYYGVDARADLLLAGAAIALLPASLLMRVRTVCSNLWLGLGAMTALVAVAFVLTDDLTSWSVYAASPIVLVCSCVLVVALAAGRSPLSAVFGWSPLSWFGRISYSMYLWHFPIGSFIARDLGWGWGYTPRMWAVAFAASFVAATASYYLVELPGQRLGARLVKARRHARGKAIPTAA